MIFFSRLIPVVLPSTTVSMTIGKKLIITISFFFLKAYPT